MELHAVETLAVTLMEEHGLYEWSFEFDRARRRAGCCHWDSHRLTLSRHLMADWEESAVRNIVLHEIAHALAGHGAGHGRKWRTIARQIGCTGDRCWSATEASPDNQKRPWVGTCPTCGHTFKRFRRLNASCESCSRGRYNAQHRIVWARAS